MESNLANAFVLETNCEPDAAFSYLHANHWDLPKAIEAWNEDFPSEADDNFNETNEGIYLI